MKTFKRLLNLFSGLFFFALGIVTTMKANIGFAPWDVFHAGLSQTLGFSIGTMTIVVGLFVLVATTLMGERLGLGSVLNMLLIGAFMDLILLSDLLPTMGSFPAGLLMMTLGLFVVSFGTYFYIRSGFGAGPRDSLMVVARRLTGLPVGLCRAIIEGLAVLAGWFLGGPAGVGTVFAAFGIGVCIQITFSFLRFDPALVRHETLAESLAAFRNWNASRGTNGN